MFSRRAFNIYSLAVGPTDDARFSRMTIVVDLADERPVEQVTKQLHKLINVIRIQELSHSEAIERELMMIRVNAPAPTRFQVVELADIFRAKVIDVGTSSITVEVTGEPDKLDAFEDLVRPHGIIDLVRTGRIAIGRGPKRELKAVKARAS
jgi:acetolactate synthase-1/3 small subunit